MIICENQTFPTQNSFYDGHPLDGETMFVYPTNIEGETKVNGICCSFRADSDRGYCQSYNTGSSSDGDQWDQFSTADVDDDVFTEREVVLAYDGSEVTSYSYGSCEMSELKREEIDQECPVSFTTEEFKQGYRDNFKDEMEEFTDISISEDFAFSLDNKDNSVGTGDEDINCSDSFLKWLDSEHVFSSSPTSSEDYYTNDSFENDNEDSSRNQLFYRESSLSSDDCYSSKATKNRPSLPPIQTMIPPWSRMIYSFDPDRSLNTTSSLFNSNIEGWNDLHSDNMNVGISEKLGDYGNVSSKSYHSNENDQLSSYAEISEIIIPDSEGNTMDDLPRRRETTSVKSMERGQVVIDQKCLLECRWEGCWSVFSGQAALVHHIEKSHVEQRRSDEFACLWQHCPRRVRPFNARYKLLIHMRVHSGEKPNKCPFSGCMKAFSRLENLKIHQRSHTGERPYSCQFPSCHKAFSNSSDRAKHQRTHYDTKPYACQAAGCRKRYTDPSSLRKHIKNHTGSTIYKNKKLMASEPVVYISSLEPHERRRLNSYVSDYGSDNQEEEYISNPNESMEETSDIELSEVHQEYGHFGLTKKIPKEITSCMADLGEMPKDLDLDIDDQLIEELDPYNIIPFADDILDLLCK